MKQYPEYIPFLTTTKLKKDLIETLKEGKKRKIILENVTISSIMRELVEGWIAYHIERIDEFDKNEG